MFRAQNVAVEASTMHGPGRYKWKDGRCYEAALALSGSLRVRVLAGKLYRPSRVVI